MGQNKPQIVSFSLEWPIQVWPPLWNTRGKNTQKYPGAGHLFPQWFLYALSAWRRQEQVIFILSINTSYITDKLLARKVMAFLQKTQAETASTRWNMKWLWNFINSAYDEIYFIYDNIHSITLIIYKGFWSNFQTLLVINKLKTCVWILLCVWFLL